MWVAKIKLNGENAIIGSRCKKFNVSVSGYPISTFYDSKTIHIYTAYFIFGEDTNIKAFIKDLRKDDKVLHIENKGNFIISQIKEPAKHACAYHHSIIHLKPLIIKENGIEFWVLGSWNKEYLNNFLNLIEKSHNGELLSVKKEKINNFSIISMRTELTNNQEKAVESAMRNGYYNYPRDIEIKKLANLNKISYSTYHAHLRKAEKKLLQCLFNQNK